MLNYYHLYDNIRYQNKPLMIWIWISVLFISLSGFVSLFKKKYEIKIRRWSGAGHSSYYGIAWNAGDGVFINYNKVPKINILRNLHI